jgi:adenosylcobalamin-dependent ribonucleoside-triphosphate reductase
MLSFHLPEEFVGQYADREVRWGFRDAGGNSIGEITFLRTYSRRKPDGTKERWHEVCERVINGMYSILKDHCVQNRLPWNELKGRASAEEAYERMFSMKWLPPGRGLWMMGTEFVHERKNSAALQNCAFVSTGHITKRDPERPFVFLMEASMLGIGVGFDTEGAKKNILVQFPEEGDTIVIEDSREGWVESTGALLRSYLVPNHPKPSFDYSLIRPAGEPIRGFGGTAAGPGPLMELHDAIEKQFVGREGDHLTSRDIVDIGNHIGRCVVAGNVRRSAEIALGDPDDREFLDLKNYDVNPERAAYGWVSNNSLKVAVGQDYDEYVPRILANGEPGFVYMDLAQRFGRLADPENNKDYRAVGFNPCVEQTLESYECCTLVETFPTNCEDKADFLRTLKYAYMYAKAVTLVPTHWPETNAVMQRNRRIGCSVSGMAQFVDTRGWSELRTWLDEGYGEVQHWDHIYAEWLGVRESIKTTSVKPSGSVSLLAGVTPGAHWPTEDTYIRRMRLAKDDPLTLALERSGYATEPAFGNEQTTVVVEIPVRGVGVRAEHQVSLFEKVNLAILAQRYWADNSVSLTLTFDREKEGQHIASILRMHEGQLKSLSFLPIDPTAYPQMPYEAILPEELEAYEQEGGLLPLDWDVLYAGSPDAVGEKYCSTDVCEIKVESEVNLNG